MYCERHNVTYEYSCTECRDEFLNNDPWDVKTMEKDYSKGEQSPYWQWMNQRGFEDREGVVVPLDHDMGEFDGVDEAMMEMARKKANLSGRAVQVLSCILERKMTQRQTAEELGISQVAVHIYWKRAAKKMKKYIRGVYQEVGLDP